MTISPGPPNPTAPYGPFSGGYGGHGSTGGSGGNPSGTATCQDEIDTTYNWVSSGPGDDPPESVIVMEQCTATAGGSDYGSDAPQVSALNGLHDTPQSTTTPIMSGPYRIGTQASTTSQGAHYRVVAGQASLPLQCTPKASATVVNGPCSASVTYSPSISPSPSKSPAPKIRSMEISGC